MTVKEAALAIVRKKLATMIESLPELECRARSRSKAWLDLIDELESDAEEILSDYLPTEKP